MELELTLTIKEAGELFAALTQGHHREVNCPACTETVKNLRETLSHFLYVSGMVPNG